jgi:UDP-GlcNAc:undecaprenyl-phosphate GlcNAc-1-phosphate transferase
LAIAIPLYLGIGLLYLWPNVISEEFFSETAKVWALLVGGGVILLLGIYDDLRGSGARLKFLFQILAALIVCALSGPVRAVSLPFFGSFHLDMLAVPVTVLWIVGITNAFNLIDGIDGLASGVGLLVCGTTFPLAYMSGSVGMMVFSAVMCGSLLAFLRYNFHPASIFLGDTGSLFIGFTLAVMSLQSGLKTSTAVTILLPICVLGYPLLDVGLAILRRSLKGKSVFSSDRSHIHHKLLDSGLGHRGSSFVAYGLTVLFTSIGILHIFGRNREGGIVFIALLLILAFMFKVFGYWDYVRDRLGLDFSVRRKFRLYNCLQKVAMLKLADAKGMDQLWNNLCWLAREYDLHTVRLTLDKMEDRVWRNAEAEGKPERCVCEYDLPSVSGNLYFSHNGQKEEEIVLEQNILLEEVIKKLEAKSRTIQGDRNS